MVGSECCAGNVLSSIDVLVRDGRLNATGRAYLESLVNSVDGDIALEAAYSKVRLRHHKSQSPRVEAQPYVLSLMCAQYLEDDNFEELAHTLLSIAVRWKRYSAGFEPV